MGDKILEWAMCRDIEFDGCKPQKTLHGGWGMFATRTLRRSQVIVHVPLTATICPIPGLKSQHGWLAKRLFDNAADDEMTTWQQYTPGLEFFEATMPLMWPEQLHDFLPSMETDGVDDKKGTKIDVFAKQQERFRDDCQLYSISSESVQEYMRCWLTISSRSFPYKYREDTGRDRDDRLALVPVIDLCNHTVWSPRKGCKVKYVDDWSKERNGYDLVTNGPCEAGDELFIQYGEYTNAYLVLEYGFWLKLNEYDNKAVTKALSRCDYDALQRMFSTRVRQTNEPHPPQSGEDALQNCLAGVENHLKQLSSLNVGTQEQRQHLARYWESQKEVIQMHLSEAGS